MVQRDDSEGELLTASSQGFLLSWDCDYTDPVYTFSERVGIEKLLLIKDTPSSSPHLLYATEDHQIHLTPFRKNEVNMVRL